MKVIIMLSVAHLFYCTTYIFKRVHGTVKSDHKLRRVYPSVS